MRQYVYEVMNSIQCDAELMGNHYYNIILYTCNGNFDPIVTERGVADRIKILWHYLLSTEYLDQAR